MYIRWICYFAGFALGFICWRLVLNRFGRGTTKSGQNGSIYTKTK